MQYSVSFALPVMLPPECAKLAAKPKPIGSATYTNTTGIIGVSWARALITGVVLTEDRVGSQVPVGRSLKSAVSAFRPAVFGRPIPEPVDPQNIQ